MIALLAHLHSYTPVYSAILVLLHLRACHCVVMVHFYWQLQVLEESWAASLGASAKPFELSNYTEETNT